MSLTRLDAADAAAVLAVLAQVVRSGGSRCGSVLLDQINTLPRQQIADVSRLLHDLNDRLRECRLVLSEVRADPDYFAGSGDHRPGDLGSFVREQGRGSTADSWPKGGAFWRPAWKHFLTPCSRAQRNSNGIHSEDLLFPLGEAWFADRFGKLIDVRPRHMIDAAREHWETLQEVARRGTR